MRIAIVGSGLAGVSAAKALIKRGIKPVVLDSGEDIDEHRRTVAGGLSKIAPGGWPRELKRTILTNPTVHDKDSFPKKLAFGSDYFYGRSIPRALTETQGPMAPFSFAKGGLSVGWGASGLADRTIGSCASLQGHFVGVAPFGTG